MSRGGTHIEISCHLDTFGILDLLRPCFPTSGYWTNIPKPETQTQKKQGQNSPAVN